MLFNLLNPVFPLKILLHSQNIFSIKYSNWILHVLHLICSVNIFLGGSEGSVALILSQDIMLEELDEMLQPLLGFFKEGNYGLSLSFTVLIFPQYLASIWNSISIRYSRISWAGDSLEEVINLGCSGGKESTCNAGDTDNLGSIPGLGRSLEKEMASHSKILAWKIPWTEDPDRL